MCTLLLHRFSDFKTAYICSSRQTWKRCPSWTENQTFEQIVRQFQEGLSCSIETTCWKHRNSNCCTIRYSSFETGWLAKGRNSRKCSLPGVSDFSFAVGPTNMEGDMLNSLRKFPMPANIYICRKIQQQPTPDRPTRIS